MGSSKPIRPHFPKSRPNIQDHSIGSLNIIKEENLEWVAKSFILTTASIIFTAFKLKKQNV